MTACKYWDCGWCYAPNYLKTNAINSTCVNPYECPISPLSEPVQYETPMTEIQKVKAEIKVLEKKLALLEEIEKQPKTLFDVIRNLGYSVDACYEIVDAVEEFQKPKEYQPTPQTPEQVADGLKEAFREAVKQGVVSSTTKPQNLTDLIYDWWEDVFTTNSNDDMETSIDDLVERIKHWLPKEQSAAGSQNAYVESAVEGFNDCLNKIRRKLR